MYPPKLSVADCWCREKSVRVNCVGVPASKSASELKKKVPNRLGTNPTELRCSLINPPSLNRCPPAVVSLEISSPTSSSVERVSCGGDGLPPNCSVEIALVPLFSMDGTTTRPSGTDKYPLVSRLSTDR